MEQQKWASADNIVSLDLALHPETKLWISLHYVSNSNTAHDIYTKIKKEIPNLAIVDARRIISTSQIVAAANMALMRRKQRQRSPSTQNQEERQPVWDIVLGAAGSTHFGHVMRDYAFGEETETSSLDQQQPAATTPILAMALDTSRDEYSSLLRDAGLGDAQSIVAFFNESSSSQEQQTTNFIQWYKLTTQEVEMSSLEQAVLTRIATKYHV